MIGCRSVCCRSPMCFLLPPSLCLLRNTCTRTHTKPQQQAAHIHTRIHTRTHTRPQQQAAHIDTRIHTHTQDPSSRQHTHRYTHTHSYTPNPRRRQHAYTHAYTLTRTHRMSNRYHPIVKCMPTCLLPRLPVYVVVFVLILRCG